MTEHVRIVCCSQHIDSLQKLIGKYVSCEWLDFRLFDDHQLSGSHLQNAFVLVDLHTRAELDDYLALLKWFECARRIMIVTHESWPGISDHVITGHAGQASDYLAAFSFLLGLAHGESDHAKSTHTVDHAEAVWTWPSGQIIYLSPDFKILWGFENDKNHIKDYIPLAAAALQPDEPTKIVHVTEPVPGFLIRETIFQAKQALMYRWLWTQAHDLNELLYEGEHTKSCYHRLIKRFNEIGLYHADSNMFSAEYVRRKLDVEIRRAKKLGQSCQVIYFTGHVHASFVTDAQLVKQVTAFLLAKYPEPHVVCEFESGHWIVIISSDDHALFTDPRLVSINLGEFLQQAGRDLGGSIRFRQIHDLQKFANADDFLSQMIQLTTFQSQ